MNQSLAETILQNQGLEFTFKRNQYRRSKKRKVTGTRPKFFVVGGKLPHFVHEFDHFQFQCDCQQFEAGKVCVHLIAVLRNILPENAWPAKRGEKKKS